MRTVRPSFRLTFFSKAAAVVRSKIRSRLTLTVTLMLVGPCMRMLRFWSMLSLIARSRRHAGGAGDKFPRVAIFGRQQTKCMTFFAVTARSADAVNVILRRLRQIVIDHVTDVGNVDSSRCDVGRHQNPDAAGAKRINRLLPLRLRAVAVNFRSFVTVIEQKPRQTVGAVFRAREDQNRTLTFIELVHQPIVFVFDGRLQNLLLDL